MQLWNRLHLWGASILSFYAIWNRKICKSYEVANCEIADTKKWVHGAPTHWRAHARIRRPVSLYVNTYLGENARFGVLAEKNAFYRFQPFSSRCQDYTWSLNPQNRHCYKVCHLENFWSTQQITHLVGRATTHTATRQTITGFLLRWRESFARFRYFLVYHSLARPNPSHPWHWDSLPIVRMFPQKSTGGDLVSLGDSGEADFVRFPFDVWPISDFYLMFGKRGCTPSNIFEDCCVCLLHEFRVSCPEEHKWPCSNFEKWPKDQK